MIDTAEIAVLALGIIAVPSIIWFFFGPKTRSTALAGANGLQEVTITVKGGYSPNVVVLKEGIPARLNFYRNENSSCSEQVVMRDFGIVRDLPAFTTTAIDFTPREPGQYGFSCGMNMLRGTIVVEGRRPH